MNQSQNTILWVGVIFVLVFLFTDKAFRDKIFNRGAAPSTNNFLLSVESALPSGSPTTGSIKLGNGVVAVLVNT